MRLFKSSLIAVVLLILLAFPFVVYFNAQALNDWWQLRGYTAPIAVSDLASQDTMTASARHIFYVNHPQVESNASQFRSDCRENEQTIILGCYHSNQDGIYIYNVQDPRLQGVQQVTAAHEMLHAAYDRLSGSEKARINNLLQNFYNGGVDPRITEAIKAYRQTEPNDVVNEMHSIFGTEVANLPPALESYYQRYFTDRHAIVAYADAYQSEFTTRENEIKADSTRLGQLKAQIDNQESSLQAQLGSINADRARLDGFRRSGKVDQYNAGVANFNSEVATYNAGVDKLRDDISTYNQLVGEYNSLAKELASLQQALDTRSAPQAIQ